MSILSFNGVIIEFVFWLSKTQRWPCVEPFKQAHQVSLYAPLTIQLGKGFVRDRVKMAQPHLNPWARRQAYTWLGGCVTSAIHTKGVTPVECSPRLAELLGSVG